MGKFSRNKGARTERAIVNAMQDAGFAALRVPLSGSCVGFKGDISFPLFGVDRKVEVKCRATGFIEIYKWLEGSDFLVIKADHKEPLVVVPLKFALRIAEIAERNECLLPERSK